VDKIRDRAELPRYARGFEREAYVNWLSGTRMGAAAEGRFTRTFAAWNVESIAKRASDEYNASWFFGTSHEYYYLPFLLQMALNPT
jgi:hypothetical protein